MGGKGEGLTLGPRSLLGKSIPTNRLAIFYGPKSHDEQRTSNGMIRYRTLPCVVRNSTLWYIVIHTAYIIARYTVRCIVVCCIVVRHGVSWTISLIPPPCYIILCNNTELQLGGGYVIFRVFIFRNDLSPPRSIVHMPIVIL